MAEGRNETVLDEEEREGIANDAIPYTPEVKTAFERETMDFDEDEMMLIPDGNEAATSEEEYRELTNDDVITPETKTALDREKNEEFSADITPIVPGSETGDREKMEEFALDITPAVTDEKEDDTEREEDLTNDDVITPEAKEALNSEKREGFALDISPAVTDENEAGTEGETEEMAEDITPVEPDKNESVLDGGERELEEFAAETAPTAIPGKVVPFERKDDDEKERGTALGITGLVLSILSLFIIPYIFAPLGIITGYFAYRNGDRSLGMWAMGIGAVGLLGTFIATMFI